MPFFFEGERGGEGTVVHMSEERYMSEETHTEKLKAERICQKRYPGWLFASRIRDMQLPFSS